jgi:hypothetical protein
MINLSVSGLSLNFFLFFFKKFKFFKKIKSSRLIFGEPTKLIQLGRTPTEAELAAMEAAMSPALLLPKQNSPKKPRHNTGRGRDPLLCSQTESLISRHDGPAGRWREWCRSSPRSPAHVLAVHAFEIF